MGKSTGRPTGIATNCQHCGREFWRRYPSRTQRFCSHRCACQAKRKPLVACRQCGKEFSAGDHQTQQFCSKRCWYQWHTGKQHRQFDRKLFRCRLCGTEFYRVPSQSVGAKYCSLQCASLARRSDIKLPGRHYGLSRWRRIRVQVIKRDGRCRKCGLPQSEHLARYRCGLHVDHIKARFSGGTDDLANLKALCCKCHAKKTVREQMALKEMTAR